MFNTDIVKLQAYTNRDFVNYGFHKANKLYEYKFTSNDRMLLDSGAISMIPLQMYDFKIAHDCILNGKKRLANEEINYKEFEDETLMTLIRTGIIICNIKKDYDNEEKIIKTAKTFNYVGKTFKQLAEDLEIHKNSFYNWLCGYFDLSKEKETRLIEIIELIKEV